MTKFEQVENIIDNTLGELADNFNRKHFSEIEREVQNWSIEYFDNNIHIYLNALIENYKITRKAKKMSYSQLVEIYTGLKMQGVNVLSFNSDTNCILFNKTTTAEIMAISNTLKATGHNNEVIIFESLSFKIRFI